MLCLYESATRLAAEVSADVADFFAGAQSTGALHADAKLFTTRIRRNIRLAEAPSFSQSIFQYAPHSHGAEDYRRLAEEVLALYGDAERPDAQGEETGVAADRCQAA